MAGAPNKIDNAGASASGREFSPALKDEINTLYAGREFAQALRTIEGVEQADSHPALSALYGKSLQAFLRDPNTLANWRLGAEAWDRGVEAGLVPSSLSAQAARFAFAAAMQMSKGPDFPNSAQPIEWLAEATAIRKADLQAAGVHLVRIASAASKRLDAALVSQALRVTGKLGGALAETDREAIAKVAESTSKGVAKTGNSAALLPLLDVAVTAALPKPIRTALGKVALDAVQGAAKTQQWPVAAALISVADKLSPISSDKDRKALSTLIPPAQRNALLAAIGNGPFADVAVILYRAGVYKLEGAADAPVAKAAPAAPAKEGEAAKPGVAAPAATLTTRGRITKLTADLRSIVLLEKGDDASAHTKETYEAAWDKNRQSVKAAVERGDTFASVVLSLMPRVGFGGGGGQANRVSGAVVTRLQEELGVERNSQGQYVSRVGMASGRYQLVSNVDPVQTVFRHILPSVKHVVELGSGRGNNLFFLHMLGGLRSYNRTYYGLEYTDAGRELADTLKTLDPKLKYQSHYFNYFEPDLSMIPDDGPTVVFSIHSIEQVEAISPKLYDQILARKSPTIVMHFEPVGWQRDVEILKQRRAKNQAFLQAMIAHRFEDIYSVECQLMNTAIHSWRNGYNTNLLSIVNDLEAAGRMNVVERIYDFTLYHPVNPTTYVKMVRPGDGDFWPKV